MNYEAQKMRLWCLTGFNKIEHPDGFVSNTMIWGFMITKQMESVQF